MAEETVVEQVRDLLPVGAKVGDSAWGMERITVLLDQGQSVNQILARFWNSKAAETATMIDISESGSSRSLSTVHENAVRMARYWDDRVKADEDAASVVAVDRGRVVLHRARRV